MVAIYHWAIDGEAPFDALTHVLDYLWDAEVKDYEASGGYEHTFEHLAKIANWLNSGADWTPLQYVEACKAGIGSGWRVSATHETPDTRTPPAPGTYPGMRIDSLNGETIDVTEAAKAAGLGCSVVVTVNVWDHLIQDDWALECGSEEASLACLLRMVAEAAAGERRDIRTSFDAVNGQGELGMMSIKALHRRGPGGCVYLTIMMDWEVAV